MPPRAGEPPSRFGSNAGVDPTTVILILALHLISTGGLFCLIGRHMPPRSGLGAFGLGAIVFGCAYAMRLYIGIAADAPLGMLLDAAMILAAFLFLGGLRQFVRRSAPTATWLAIAVAVYLLLRVGVVSAYGQVGRYLVLNETLGVTYLALAGAAALESRREVGALRLPLRLLVALMAGLGLLTVLRGVVIFEEGTAAMYAGASAQIFYIYSSFAAVLLGPILLWMVFVRLNGQLAELATHDALTRLLNRNGLDDVLRRHFGARDAAPLTLLQVDIDHFKRINDTHGHNAGDAVLRTVASALADNVRGGDFVARTGGEEFLVGCTGADAATAWALAERLREAAAMARTTLPGHPGELRCTISIGISRQFGRLGEWQTAARLADEALYVAKQSGRDRVEVAP
jgi:diguanylate cyclase (GGDEF)-like protein